MFTVREISKSLEDNTFVDIYFPILKGYFKDIILPFSFPGVKPRPNDAHELWVLFNIIELLVEKGYDCLGYRVEGYNKISYIKGIDIRSRHPGSLKASYGGLRFFSAYDIRIRQAYINILSRILPVVTCVKDDKRISLFYQTPTAVNNKYIVLDIAAMNTGKVELQEYDAIEYGDKELIDKATKALSIIAIHTVDMESMERKDRSDTRIPVAVQELKSSDRVLARLVLIRQPEYDYPNMLFVEPVREFDTVIECKESQEAYGDPRISNWKYYLKVKATKKLLISTVHPPSGFGLGDFNLYIDPEPFSKQRIKNIFEHVLDLHE